MIDRALLFITDEIKDFPGLLVFYLEHGYLPPASSITTRTLFEEQLGGWLNHLTEQAHIGQLKNTLRHDATAKRLLSIVPAKHLWLLLEKLSGSAAVHDIGKAILQLETAIAHYPAHFSLYVSKLSPFHHLFRSIMTEALLKWIVYQKEEVFPLGFIAARTMLYAGYTPEMPREIFAEINLKKSEAFDAAYEHALNSPTHVEPLQQLFFTDSTPQKVSVKPPGPEGIRIFNAGLVLAANYLNDFFERTGLKQDRQFVYPALAIAVLQWIATGAEQAAEFELVLPKLLCGIELHQCLPQVKEIPAFIKQEGQYLMESMGISKNTPVAALRALFLQRQGNLSFVNGHWHLDVEPHAHNALQAPFPTAIIKLSFMKEAIYVEW